MDAVCDTVNDIQAPKLYHSYSNRFDNANCTSIPMQINQFCIQSWGE